MPEDSAVQSERLHSFSTPPGEDFIPRPIYSDNRLLAERTVLFFHLVVLEDDHNIALVIGVGVGGLSSTDDRDRLVLGIGRRAKDTADLRRGHIILNLVQIFLRQGQRRASSATDQNERQSHT
jgi:hypothetical protein